MRAEDSFDVAPVDAWLRTRVPDLPAGRPTVRQFPGGASNLTYLLRWADDGERPARTLVLRRPPHGARGGSAHDMAREFTLQAALRPAFAKVPRVLAHADDGALLGAPASGGFYVMEHVEGTILRGDLDPDLAAAVAPGDLDALCASAVDVLAELHDVDVDATGLAEFGRAGSSVERQVAGWTRRFGAARTPDVPDFAATTAWLADHRPSDVGRCLVHNDYRFDNLVLAEGPTVGAPFEIVAVLDWELATVGDPLCELGSALAYWVQADDDADFLATRRQPTHLPGMWSRQRVVEEYAGRRGLTVDAEGWRFYEVFGLFRLAVIVQQIWARYVAGATTNRAFAGFGGLVALLDERCRRVVADGPVGWAA